MCKFLRFDKPILIYINSLNKIISFFFLRFEREFKLTNVHKSETKNGRELLQREEKF